MDEGRSTNAYCVWRDRIVVYGGLHIERARARDTASSFSHPARYCLSHCETDTDTATHTDDHTDTYARTAPVDNRWLLRDALVVAGFEAGVVH